MNDAQTKVLRDDFIQAVDDVHIFADMSDEQLLKTFDHYDLNNNGILTVKEAFLVFKEETKILWFAEYAAAMWDSLDINDDDAMDQAEFLAIVQLLTSAGILPEIPSAQVRTVYRALLASYNSNVSEPIAVLPLTELISDLKEKAPAMWDAFLAEVN